MSQLECTLVTGFRLSPGCSACNVTAFFAVRITVRRSVSLYRLARTLGGRPPPCKSLDLLIVVVSFTAMPQLCNCKRGEGRGPISVRFVGALVAF